MTLAASYSGSGVWFSPCETYRYMLWRKWGEGPRCLFVMLNPSTADGTKDDPTIRRCVGFARAWGFDGIEVANIFALRSPNPEDLYGGFVDPIGPENDSHIMSAAAGAGRVVCAWGNHGRLAGRGATVLAMMLAAGVEPWCFKLTKSTRTKPGQPEHPLYQPRAAQLRRLEAA